MDDEQEVDQMPTMTADLMTLKDAAAELRMSYSKMYRLARDGGVPVYKVAGRTLVHRNDVAALIVPPDKADEEA